MEEPDLDLWKDERTGLYCLVMRTTLGALCGYVGLPNEHPLYAVHYLEESFPDVNVHGGVTFSDRMTDRENLWWVGFDCSHYGDYVPGMASFMNPLNIPSYEKGVYRDMSYVRAECASLAEQLSNFGIAPRLPAS